MNKWNLNCFEQTMHYLSPKEELVEEFLEYADIRPAL